MRRAAPEPEHALPEELLVSWCGRCEAVLAVGPRPHEDVVRRIRCRACGPDAAPRLARYALIHSTQDLLGGGVVESGR